LPPALSLVNTPALVEIGKRCWDIATSEGMQGLPAANYCRNSRRCSHGQIQMQFALESLDNPPEEKTLTSSSHTRKEHIMPPSTKVQYALLRGIKRRNVIGACTHHFQRKSCDEHNPKNTNPQREKNNKKIKIISTFSINSFCFVCSLSSHRHFFIPLIFGSRFIDS
jgi:hypothetical protein